MDRFGMQSVGFMILLSFSVLIVLNHHSAFVWSTSSFSHLAATGSEVASFGMEDVHASTIGAELRRRLLQVTPVAAPAPGPGSDTSISEEYISYGALTAAFVPCPPQTGRSYYTPDCQTATGPVNPYTRGCTVIGQCARD